MAGVHHAVSPLIISTTTRLDEAMRHSAPLANRVCAKEHEASGRSCGPDSVHPRFPAALSISRGDRRIRGTHQLNTVPDAEESTAANGSLGT